MQTNFDFLKTEWSKFLESATEAEKNVYTAPRTCIFYCRFSMEKIIRWLYDHDDYLKRPYQETLSAMIHEQTFKDNLAPGLFNRINYVRKIGNFAVHDSGKVNVQESLTALRHLYAFISWFVAGYSENPPSNLSFDESILPKKGAKDKSVQDLLKVQNQLDSEVKDRQKQLDEKSEEIERLRQQIHEIKQKNKEVVPEEDYTEDETRILFIDLLLREAGWDPHGKNVREYEVQGMPNQKGVGYADYVLWGDNGKPVAVIEAKKTKVDPKIGQRQAELYADCLESMTDQRPIIFYSNGYETWLWDDLKYPPREVQGFYNKDELQLLINRRDSVKNIKTASVNKDIAGRYYQEEAIRRVAESFSDNARETLLVMATGTGKTRVSIAIVEMLMKANWVRRTLFLADRTALIKQAKNAFTQHLKSISVTDITKDKEDDQSRIVFSTYPTMMNCIDGTKKDDRKRYGVGHFDLIIIDEAHRSVYLKYRAIFEYFDALLLGLTATPKSDIHHNTYQLLKLENDVPTYAYELDLAVKDGFLVPPKAVSVPMKFHQTGIKYDELSDDEKEEYEMTFRDEEDGSMPKAIEPSKLNSWVFNKNTVDQVLVNLMESGIKVEGGDKLGKTIIFAKSHKHAEFIQERFNKCFPQLKGKFLRIIDNQVNYAQSLIDDFSIKTGEPTIALSVDMLDTGIDIPEIVNLVFFKIVRSKAKFWQMIGRGTRLCENLFAPDQHKKEFLIFDYCENFEFFDEHPEGYDGKVQEPISQRIFKKRLELIRHLQSAEYQSNEKHEQLYMDILDIIHRDVDRLDENSFQVRAHKKYVDRFRDRKQWNNITDSDAIDINEHLSHIIDPDKDDDELARRFDLQLLSLQLALIIKGTDQAKYTNIVIAYASALEKKANIPSVAQQIDLIHEIQRDEFWENISLPMLEDVRKRIRDLIKFIDKEGRETVYTNFEDTMGEVSVREDIANWPIINSDNYRKKVERYIRQHEDHITINKLKFNKPITPVDLEELERMLFSNDETGTKEEFEKAFGSERPLGVFIRSIVGLDRNAAKESFSSFLSNGALSADQITFLDKVIDYLTHNGVMEPEKLFETPFIDIHVEGVVGVFDTDQAENIVKIIHEINDNAVAA